MLHRRVRQLRTLVAELMEAFLGAESVGRIQQLLNEAQDGQAFANLARAFHLQPDKVEPAVAAMIADLVAQLQTSMTSRRSLAALVELLGKGVYPQVLDNPVLLGATSTQVAGNKILNIIAEHNENSRTAQHAAGAAHISEMISEYLLPVVAAMLVGALVKENRAQLDAIIGGDANDPADGEAVEMMQLPRASGGGANFTGITSGTIAGATNTESRYSELAEEIRRGSGSCDSDSPAKQVRRILSETLGVTDADQSSSTGAPVGETGNGAIRCLLSGWRR